MRPRLFTLRVPPSASEFHRKTHTQLPDKDRGRKSHSSVLWWGGFPPTTLSANWMPVSLHQRPASQQLNPSLISSGNPANTLTGKERKKGGWADGRWLSGPALWAGFIHLISWKTKKKKSTHTGQWGNGNCAGVKMWKSWTEFTSGMFWMMWLGSSGSGNLDLGCLRGSGVAMFQVWPASPASIMMAPSFQWSCWLS